MNKCSIMTLQQFVHWIKFENPSSPISDIPNIRKSIPYVWICIWKHSHWNLMVLYFSNHWMLILYSYSKCVSQYLDNVMHILAYLRHIFQDRNFIIKVYDNSQRKYWERKKALDFKYQVWNRSKLEDSWFSLYILKLTKL